VVWPKKLTIERNIRMSRDEDTVLHVFNEYVQAFQTLRASAVAPYIHLPCMLISPQGVDVMTSPISARSASAAANRL
jgi:hypothetical protein